MAEDRRPRRRGYQPDFDLDLERGAIKEQLVRRLLTDDDDRLKVEVKGDDVAVRTHNHYAEYAQRGRGGRWRDSGIRTTRSNYWAVALPDGTVAFVPVAKMRRLVERAIDAGHVVTMRRGDNPTRGALVPLSRLVA
jgi:hypothetical protein